LTRLRPALHTYAELHESITVGAAKLTQKLVALAFAHWRLRGRHRSPIHASSFTSLEPCAASPSPGACLPNLRRAVLFFGAQAIVNFAQLGIEQHLRRPIEPRHALGSLGIVGVQIRMAEPDSLSVGALDYLGACSGMNV
jgi:hypothetical protein